MNCEDVRDKLGDYLDKEMLDELCLEIKSHLKLCRDCTVEVDTLQKTILLYQADSKHAIELPLRVTQRLEQALAKEYGNERTKGND